AKALASMKKGAYLVNTCRGKVVFEEDIVAALESGQLAGYGTDVYYSDPPENTPLAKAPHVVMTPHLGASTAENLDRLGDCIVERVRKYCKK
ncbi:MAG TPA: NAD(P)-dependent oxidoreductase, partial [Spirochaetales bacterium]|nr:NAD(P)-dependent oxidoreductase [Spirochaetales bacterium]